MVWNNVRRAMGALLIAAPVIFCSWLVLFTVGDQDDGAMEVHPTTLLSDLFGFPLLLAWLAMTAVGGWRLTRTGQPMRLHSALTLLCYGAGMRIFFGRIPFPQEWPPLEWESLMVGYIVWLAPALSFLEIVLPPWRRKAPGP